MIRPASERRRGRRSATPRRRVSVVGVLGEVLITAGVFVLLFLGWQLWLNDIIVGQQKREEAVQISQEWNRVEGTAHGTPQEPPVAAAAAPGDRFGLLIVPRFGADFYRPIAEGIGVADVLNKGNIGHYPDTQMPGEAGNFAVAAHRSAYGGHFHNMHELRVGDHIYVETVDGWYQYEFRNLEYVQPTAVTVLNPVPKSDAEPTDQMITLTSCNPFWSTAERIIAYGVFQRFFARDDGPPAEIEDTVAGGAG